MVEWKLSAAGKALPSAQVSDGAINVGQLARLIKMSPRPFVLINERELSVLRRGLTKDGWKRILYLQPADPRNDIYVGAGLLSTANQWLEKDIKIPEPGGDMRLFVCECGARLETPEGFEVQHKYSCPVCSREYSGKDCDGAIRHMQHERLAGAALSLALIYSIEKDRAYSDKAAEILLKYGEYYQAQGKSACIIQNTSAEAAWAIAMAQAYDLIYYSRSLSEQDRGAIETQLFKPLADRFTSLGNEGVPGAWHLSAAGVIGLSIKDAQLAAAAMDSCIKWVGSQIGDDGICPAHPSEHFGAASALLHLAEAFYRIGIDLFENKSLKRMFLAPLNLMYPSFRFPAIGDGPFDSFLPLDPYEVAYRRWGDPEFSWVLKNGYKFCQAPVNSYQLQHPQQFCRSGFYAFLFGRDLPGRSAPPAFKSADYPSLGMYSLRSGDDLMATVDYYAHRWNSHPGRLGLTLSVGDDVVISDNGTPAKCSADIADCSRSTAAHNTVMVDEKSQSQSGESGLVAQCAGSHIQAVECIANHCYPGVSHMRKIVMIEGICIVMDHLKSDIEHDYDWLMHCQGIAHMHDDGKLIENKTSNVLEEWEKVYEMPGESRIDWQLPSGKLLAVTMWHLSGSGEFALGNCAADIACHRASLMRFRQHGKEACFLAVMAPLSTSDGISIKRAGNVITLKRQDSIEYLFMRGCDNTEAASKESALETDAQFAAVRTCNGEIRSMTLTEGSWLKWHGESVLECSSKVGCLELVFEERGPQMKYSGEASGMVKVRTNARALRVNGVRAQAYNTDGYATLCIAGQMVSDEMLPHKN